MWDSQYGPRSDRPYAPKIPYSQYFDEKAYFAGTLVASILHGTPTDIPLPISPCSFPYFLSILLGIVVILFFKCMAALVNPVDRRGEPIKWGIVSYTMVMYSVVTVQTAMDLDVQTISYIDNRGFPGVKGEVSPGPIGYQSYISHQARGIFSNVMFFLNVWLADGLLVSFSV